MQYLYHGVPNDMAGTTLYPLNELRKTNSELYDVKAAKYEGRKGVMERSIPTLNCLWNDVLHLTALHPELLMDALLEAGRPVGQSMQFYQIDPNLLEPENTTVYLYSYREKSVEVPLSDFVEFDVHSLPSYAVIPEETKAYFSECYESDRRPLLFHGIPHILYKGTIDVADVPIVAV